MVWFTVFGAHCDGVVLLRTDTLPKLTARVKEQKQREDAEKAKLSLGGTAAEKGAIALTCQGATGVDRRFASHRAGQGEQAGCDEARQAHLGARSRHSIPETGAPTRNRKCIAALLCVLFIVSTPVRVRDDRL